VLDGAEWSCCADRHRMLWGRHRQLLLQLGLVCQSGLDDGAPMNHRWSSRPKCLTSASTDALMMGETTKQMQTALQVGIGDEKAAGQAEKQKLFQLHNSMGLCAHQEIALRPHITRSLVVNGFR
jgi:hypothetical protein